MGIRQEVAFKSNCEIFRCLPAVANVSTLTPEERYHYEADVKNTSDTLNQIMGAFKDGENKGRVRVELRGRVDDGYREKARSLAIGARRRALVLEAMIPLS